MPKGPDSLPGENDTDYYCMSYQKGLLACQGKRSLIIKACLPKGPNDLYWTNFIGMTMKIFDLTINVQRVLYMCIRSFETFHSFPTSMTCSLIYK